MQTFESRSRVPLSGLHLLQPEANDMKDQPLVRRHLSPNETVSAKRDLHTFGCRHIYIYMHSLDSGHVFYDR